MSFRKGAEVVGAEVVGAEVSNPPFHILIIFLLFKTHTRKLKTNYITYSYRIKKKTNIKLFKQVFFNTIKADALYS